MRVFLVFAVLVLAGCADSHGREVGEADGGTTSDAGATRDGGSSPHDGGAGPLDAGPRGACEPEDAREIVCPESVCDGLPTWHWNGDSCVPIECGACEGTDCADAPRSRADCEALHARCEAALCTSSGGEWLWWAEECGHFDCGFPPPVACLVGTAVCDCGFGRRFDAERGCVAADCPVLDALPRDELCRATGGEWGPFCCDSVCGERCADACVSDACHCPGATQVFDSVRGCVEGTQCFERGLGQTCHERARCAPGTLCCDRCGGAGCAGAPTCVAPTCDDDPAIDTCGNRLDAP